MFSKKSSMELSQARRVLQVPEVAYAAHAVLPALLCLARGRATPVAMAMPGIPCGRERGLGFLRGRSSSVYMMSAWHGPNAAYHLGKIWRSGYASPHCAGGSQKNGVLGPYEIRPLERRTALDQTLEPWEGSQTLYFPRAARKA